MMQVAVLRSETKSYAENTLFYPAATFPELARAGIHETDTTKGVYRAVRSTLICRGIEIRQSVRCFSYATNRLYVSCTG